MLSSELDALARLTAVTFVKARGDNDIGTSENME